MAVENPATDEAKITSLLGQLGVDLRTDDADYADAIADAVDAGTAELWGFLGARYAAADLADSTWAQWHATWFAIRHLCQRRINDVPESVAKECDRREKQLALVRDGKAKAPFLPNARRPVAVSGYHVDLNRVNNQVRVDRNRSTGVQKDYRRRTDPGAPDGG